MSQNPNSEKGQLILAIKEEKVLVMPESKVNVHIGIMNQGVIEDYFDILVKGVPSDWITLDTPVVHLAPGETKQVILSIQPPPLLQSRIGQYPLDVHAIGQNNPRNSAVAHSMLTVAAYQSGGRIGVTLGSIYFSVTPGSNITIPVLLQNQGLREDVFQLTIEGIPANWISTNAVFTRLEPAASQEIELTIRVPRSPEADAGRKPFKIVLISQDYPDQKAEAECILTIAAFSKFSASLQPGILQADQAGRLTIHNEGNTNDTYSLSFQNPAGALIFEKAVQISRTTQSGVPKVEMAYVEIPKDEKIQINTGGQVIYPFRSRLRSRPLIGNEKAYPFTIKLASAENIATELPGETNDRGVLPPWLAALLLAVPLIVCLLFAVPVLVRSNDVQDAIRTTQTAAFAQTQAAMIVTLTPTPSGQMDADGDGLTNENEIKAGTDILKPDTDEDGLSDGLEVTVNLTNPLVPDSDQDTLSDGDEVLTYKTNPLNPDTDGDALKDADEITRRTDPLNLDTDKDGLGDGVEVNLATDPTQPDTDKDGLLDGQENQTCPRPLVPDSDGDGVLDGKDLEACNPNNPLWTATAIAAAQTQLPRATTAVPPTNAPPTTAVPSNTVVIPTNTVLVPTNTVSPTNTLVIPTNTTIAPLPPSPTIPPLQGVMLFESNRDGNSEIYATNLASQSLLRLTNHPAVDMQPALAPDSMRVAYVSNQNGNNEIYLTGLDRQPPVNLTNNPVDDQQPAWSPDGNWIVFTSNRDGNQEIYVMRSDGSEIRNLTANPASDFAAAWFTIPGFLGLGTENWIVFTSNRDGNQEIYRIKPDGTGLANLTRHPSNDYAPNGFSGGRLVAFVTDRDGNPEIYTMTPDGDSPANMTNNFSQDLDPAIDPSGKWVSFSSDRDGNLEIYVVELANRQTYNLTRNPARDVSPDW